MDKTLLPQLFAGPADYSEYIACAIYIHDYTKLLENIDDEWMRLCAERDLVLHVQLEGIVREAVNAVPSILTTGLQIVWPLINPEALLLPCSTANNRWYEAQHQGSNVKIHLNIATGSLLLNLKPVSILPESYTRSKIYKQVLEDRLVDVVASDDPRMEYMTVKTIDGHQVYFGIDSNSGETFISTEKDNLRYAAILRNKFEDDLPVKILENSRPWLCIDTLTIEFRNKSHLWCSGESDWYISSVKIDKSTFKMESQKSFLIDNRQGVGSSVCSVLASLEVSKYIHILLDKKRRKLLIELPRYHLNFEVDPHGQLHCNELAAFVRSSQELETFHGLRNRLVLQAERSKSTNPKLWVLVPSGKVTVKSAGPHVSVSIDNDGENDVTVYKYRIDKTLRCLVPDQIEGHLWKAYIHICTSSALPDALTGCTGIEESFRTLDDHWLKTCVPFSSEAQEILKMIAKVSAVRSFYPPTGASRMQQTGWNDGMPSMFQHDGFHKRVLEINNHNKKAQFLNEGTTYLNLEYRGNDKDLVLAERALYAWRKYWPAGFASGEGVTSGDEVYVSRDKGIMQSYNSVSGVATAISSWKAPTSVRCNLFKMLEERQRKVGSKGFPDVLCFSTTFKPTSLTQLLTIDVNKSWADLFQYCLKVKKDDKAELLFAMSMIVFGNAALLNDIKALLSFAILPELKTIGLPDEETYGTLFGDHVDWCRYDLLQGDDLDWSVITDIMAQCRIKPADRVPETTSQHRLHAQMKEQEKVRLNSQRSIIKKAVKAAWPDGELILPDARELDRFDVDSLRKMLFGRLITWKKNGILRAHCKRWERELVKISDAGGSIEPDVWLSPPSPWQSPRFPGYPLLFQAMIDPPSVHTQRVCEKAMVAAFDGSIKDIFNRTGHGSVERGQEQQLIHQELMDIVRTKIGIQDAIKKDYTDSLVHSTLR